VAGGVFSRGGIGKDARPVFAHVPDGIAVRKCFVPIMGEVQGGYLDRQQNNTREEEHPVAHAGYRLLFGRIQARNGIMASAARSCVCRLRPVYKQHNNSIDSRRQIKIQAEDISPPAE